MIKLKRLRGFASWIVFALFPNSMVAWAALTGLVVSLVLFVQDRRRGIKLDALVLDIATLFFFAALGIGAFADPRAPLGTWSSPLSFGWLALIAWGSIAIGQPFTLGMARRRVARDVWEQPAFRRSQTALTRLWAIIFTLITVALAVCVSAHQSTVVTLAIRLGGLAIGAHLTARHISAARRRMAVAASVPQHWGAVPGEEARGQAVVEQQGEPDDARRALGRGTIPPQSRRQAPVRSCNIRTAASGDSSRQLVARF